MKAAPLQAPLFDTVLFQRKVGEWGENGGQCNRYKRSCLQRRLCKHFSTCLVDFLYNFLHFSFWEEGMMLKLNLYVSTTSLSHQVNLPFSKICFIKFMTKTKLTLFR